MGVLPSMRLAMGHGQKGVAGLVYKGKIDSVKISGEIKKQQNHIPCLDCFSLCNNLSELSETEIAKRK